MANKELVRMDSRINRSKAMATSKAEIAAQRAKNGGKCDYEIMRDVLSEAKAELKSEVSEIMQPVIDYLRTLNSTPFVVSMRLDLQCGRMPQGKARDVLGDMWVKYELNRHKNPPEDYDHDLKVAYLDMCQQSQSLINEHREWFYSYPKVKKPLAYKEDPHFWGSVKPQKRKF